MSHPALRVAAGVAATGAACLGWGLLEAALPTMRRVTIPVLAPGAEPLTVLQLADIHLLPGQRRKRRFLRELPSLQPDLVVNTGDNLSSADAVEPLLDDLAPLLELPGVFVFGSNDYRSPGLRNPLEYLVHGRSQVEDDETDDLPTDELRAAFTGAGWHDLTHRRAELELKGTRFAFRGTDDAHLERDDYEEVAGPAAPDAVNVGVTHAPYLHLLDAMTADGVDLMIAGHTHGGQVCVPGHGALVTNCDLEPARAKGLSQHRHAGRTSWLHVSAGLGTSPFAPYRFACRPELNLLTLTPRGH